jgi:hypothetical protein
MESAALSAVASLSILGSKKRKREGSEIKTIAKTSLGVLLNSSTDPLEHGKTSIVETNVPLSLSGSLKPAPLVKNSIRLKRSSKDDENKNWFGMKAKTAGEITQEMKRDLLVLANRAYLDPKRKYKTKSEDKGRLGRGIPRFFEIGTVVESSGSSKFSNAPTREPMSKAKAEHSSLVAGLLADETFRKYAKKTSEAIRKRTERSRSHVQPKRSSFKSFKASSSSFKKRKG